MDRNLANDILAELQKLTSKKSAICDLTGQIIARTPNFDIEHNPLDVSTKKSLPLRFENKKIGYLYIDDKTTEISKIRKAALSLSKIIIQKSYLDHFLTSDEKRLDQVVYNFLNGEHPKAEDFGRVLDSFKIDANQNRIAILVEISDPDYLFLFKKEVLEGEREQKVKRIKNQIQSVIKTFYTRYPKNVITYLGRTNFLILKDMGDQPKEYQEEFKKTLSSFLFNIEQELRTKITVGVGDFKKGVTGIKESHEEAQTALSFGKQIWGPGKIYHYDNFGVVAPLFSGVNSDNVTFSRAVIGRLHQTPSLYESLEYFFKENLSLAQTAAALKIHRNTLVYRLERIAELTGLDPRKFNDAFQLKIALILEKYDE